MAYNRIQAGRLLSKGEMEMFTASLPEENRRLTASRLRALIRRARDLRDKYRDLLRRQSRETRSRTGTKFGRDGTANQRTEQKAQVFGEVLERFEKRLARSESAQARATRDAAPGPSRGLLKKKRDADGARAAARQRKVSPKAPAKGPSGGSSLGPTSESARAARHARQFEAAGSRAIQGHVSSQVRRNQAKRDGRR